MLVYFGMQFLTNTDSSIMPDTNSALPKKHRQLLLQLVAEIFVSVRI